MMIPKEEFKPFTYFFDFIHNKLPDFIRIESPPTSIWVKNSFIYVTSYPGAYSIKPGSFKIKLTCSILPCIVELHICEEKMYEILRPYYLKLLVTPHPPEKLHNTYSSLQVKELFTSEDFLLALERIVTHPVMAMYDEQTIDSLKIYYSAIMYQKDMMHHFNIK